MDEYNGGERRRGLSEDDIERIAELAAKKALDKVYLDVGKGVVKRLYWIVGSAIVGFLIWLGQNHIDLK